MKTMKTGLFLCVAGACMLGVCGAEPVSDAEVADYLVPYKYGKPIIEPSGVPGAFDELAVDHPKAFVHDGRFYLSYLGYDGISYQTGLAVSDDLLHWTRLGVVFRRGDSTNGWDRMGRVVSGYLRDNDYYGTQRLLARDGRYYLTYHAYPGKGYESGGAANGLAWAASPTSLVWTAHDRPILQKTDTAGDWDAAGLYSAAPYVRPDGQVWLYYTAKEQRKWPWHEQVGVAFSADGSLLNWTRHAGNPVCRTGTTAFDTRFCGGSDMFYDARRKTYVRYYMAFDGRHARVGLGLSRDGLAWRNWPKCILDVGGPGSLDETHAHKTAFLRKDGRRYLIYCAVRPLKDDAERAKFKKGRWNEFRCLTIASSEPFN